ncbi:MAG TPA: carboxypeptidase regulatory-like domain-containing protein [Candidatus Thermoplasmatota archaeon]|nr:carboxypeptidase regulatory-like domain-containing protein [Candidatus Thermoplasmatota archaeon]
MRPPATVLVVLGSLLLSGCTSGSNNGGDLDVPGAPADGDPIGAVSGQVLDDERRPLSGVNVRLEPVGRNDTTNEAGRFLFAKIPVGAYELNITLGGFHSRTLSLNVSEARTTAVSILLVPLPADVSFHETMPFKGLQRCMFYTSAFKASCTYPYTAVYGNLHKNGVNLSNYGAPTDLIENRFRYNFTARADHTGIVSELSWRAQTEASRYYTFQLSCPWYDPTWDDCVVPGATAPANENTYAVARGISPLRIEWKAEKATWLPWIMARAYLWGGAERPAGAALDQTVEMWNTVFYGGPVPKGFSIASPPT